MKKPVFYITWSDGNLLYYPFASRISNRRTGETHSISTHHSLRSVDHGDDFQPFCLTIYLSHLCNLSCRYCYVNRESNLPLTTFSSTSLWQTAEWIADNCVRRNKPFILGFHGGNEPLLLPALIEEILFICKTVASKRELELLPYCTTNGILEQETAIWARDRFHGITLSWDGPADIHDANRRRKNGDPTSQIVQKSAQIFRGNVARFKVRVTVTNSAVSQLLQITKFLHQQQIRDVEFYPVYQDITASLDDSLKPDPIEFVTRFLAARKWGRRHGMTIGFAATRIESFHHCFCPIFQDNLTITPDGFFTSCFLATHNAKKQFERYMFGSIDSETQHPVFDMQALNSQISRLNVLSPKCKSCFNRWHCAMGCPEKCALRSNEETHYNCIIEKWIGLANVIEAAGIEITNNQINNCKEFFEEISIRELQQ